MKLKILIFLHQLKTANLLYIDNPDLISLLGNILDNAVEAVKSSKEKRIDLSINKANGFDILTCTNSCDRKLMSVDNILISSKTKDGFHGVGIKRIVAKYQGCFE